jgi:hypothetical protein
MKKAFLAEVNPRQEGSSANEHHIRLDGREI